MTINLSEQEVNQLLAFLNTTQISGRDATALVILRQKIIQQFQANQRIIQLAASNIKPKDEPKKKEKNG